MLYSSLSGATRRDMRTSVTDHVADIIIVVIIVIMQSPDLAMSPKRRRAAVFEIHIANGRFLQCKLLPVDIHWDEVPLYLCGLIHINGTFESTGEGMFAWELWPVRTKLLVTMQSKNQYYVLEVKIDRSFRLTQIKT